MNKKKRRVRVHEFILFIILSAPFFLSLTFSSSYLQPDSIHTRPTSHSKFHYDFNLVHIYTDHVLKDVKTYYYFQVDLYQFLLYIYIDLFDEFSCDVIIS